jgi:hypothetical protein
MTVERFKELLRLDSFIPASGNFGEFNKSLRNDKECFLFFLEFIKDLFEKELYYKNIEIIEFKDLPAGTFIHQYNLRGFSDFYTSVSRIQEKIRDKTFLDFTHEIYVTGEPPCFEAFYLCYFRKDWECIIPECIKHEKIILIPFGPVEQIIPKNSKLISVLDEIFRTERPLPEPVQLTIVATEDYSDPNEKEKTHPIYKHPMFLNLKSLFCKKGYRNEIIYELINELENELDIE